MKRLTHAGSSFLGSSVLFGESVSKKCKPRRLKPQDGEKYAPGQCVAVTAYAMAQEFNILSLAQTYDNHSRVTN